MFPAVVFLSRTFYSENWYMAKGERMACDDRWRSLIERSVNIGLSLTLDAQLEHHLAGCPACRAYREKYVHLKTTAVPEQHPELKFGHVLDRGDDALDRKLRQHTSVRSLIITPILGLLIFALFSIPYFRGDPAPKPSRSTLLLSKELLDLEVDQLPEGMDVELFPLSAPRIPLRDLRYAHDGYDLPLNMVFRASLRNGLDKRYFILAAVDHRYRLHLLTGGTTSLDLYQRRGAWDFSSLRLPPSAVPGKCLFVGLYTDRALTRDDLETMVSAWKEETYALDSVHSFQRGTMVVVSLLVNLVAPPTGP